MLILLHTLKSSLLFLFSISSVVFSILDVNYLWEVADV